jgi:hypothetical protein
MQHERIRECLEADDYTLYCIDDGRHHAMIARRVGASPSGCEYTLLGRISRHRYEELRDEVVLLVTALTQPPRCDCAGSPSRGHPLLQRL